MKNIFRLLLTLTLISGAQQIAFALPLATIEAPQGEVFIHKADAPAEEWVSVTAGTSVSEGDAVKTGNGSCTLTYNEEGSFVLTPNTSISIAEGQTHNIHLDLGKLQAKVNHAKITKNFHVITPTAVGAVRGTEFDFGYNENGELTLDMHEGELQVFNEDANLKMNLGNGKSVIIKYDVETGILVVKNECDSNGIITFNVAGTEYAENPCEERTIELTTAAGGNGNPDPPGSDDPEIPEDPPGDVTPF